MVLSWDSLRAWRRRPGLSWALIASARLAARKRPMRVAPTLPTNPGFRFLLSMTDSFRPRVEDRRHAVSRADWRIGFPAPDVFGVSLGLAGVLWETRQRSFFAGTPAPQCS